MPAIINRVGVTEFTGENEGGEETTPDLAPEAIETKSAEEGEEDEGKGTDSI
jgi:hypothetical protein